MKPFTIITAAFAVVSIGVGAFIYQDQSTNSTTNQRISVSTPAPSATAPATQHPAKTAEETNAETRALLAEMQRIRSEIEREANQLAEINARQKAAEADIDRGKAFLDFRYRAPKIDEEREAKRQQERQALLNKTMPYGEQINVARRLGIAKNLQLYSLHWEHLVLKARIEAIRNGDLNVCELGNNEIVDFETTLKNAPTNIRDMEFFEATRFKARRNKWASHVQTLVLTPACDGQPVDWSKLEDF